jgi:hypothetical protein
MPDKKGRYKMQNQKRVAINSDQDLSLYIGLKVKEKRLQEKINSARPAFISACDLLVPVTGKDGKMQHGPATIYSQERAEYRYNFDIIALEQALADAKREYEANNKPMRVTKTWCVKFNGTANAGPTKPEAK